MGVSIRAVQFAADTGGGTQDITISGFGTPKGAVFYATVGTSNGSAATHAIFSNGATDGTSQAVICGSSEDAVGTSNGFRRGATDELIMILNPNTGAVVAEANFSSWITDGIRINWGVTPPSAYLITCVLWGGTDTSFKVGNFTATGGDGGTVDVDCGFTPDVVQLFGNGTSLSDSAGTNMPINLGFAVDDGSETNRGASFISNDAQAAAETYLIAHETYAGVNLNPSGGAISRSIEITAFISGATNGFTATLRAGTSSSDLASAYWAASFNGAVSYATGTMNTPTSTGNNSQTGPGFVPQAVILLASGTTTTGSQSFGGNYAVGVFTSSDEMSESFCDEDNADTTDTQSLADNTAINLPLDTGASGWDAAFVSMDATGWTLNFTATQGTAAKWMWLAIQTDAASSSSSSSSSSTTSSSSSSSTSTVSSSSSSSSVSYSSSSSTSSSTSSSSTTISSSSSSSSTSSSSTSISSSSSSSSTSSSSTSVSSSSTSVSSSSSSISLPPTFYPAQRALGITVVAETSLISGLGVYEDLTSKMEAYTHTISANGGYTEARIQFSDTLTNALSWIESGVGRHISVYNTSNYVVWEGFVNELNISSGVLTSNIGPLTDVANRVIGSYTDYATGVPTETTSYNNTTSQAIYGILTKVVSIGQVSDTNAVKIVETYLQDNAWPKLNQSLSGASNVTVELICAGYYSLLNYPYLNSGTTTYTLREKLIDVLAYDPNSIISTDYVHIDANSLSVEEYDYDYRPASEIIKELTALGASSTNDRMLFGIYNDRKAHYSQVPSDIEYTQRLTDYSISLRDQVGGDVDPWDVKPGKWINISDIAWSDLSDLNKDKASIFIESVTYTAPFELSISGGDVTSLPQRLAKLGLGGIG